MRLGINGRARGSRKCILVAVIAMSALLGSTSAARSRKSASSQSNQAEAAKPVEEKKAEAAQAAAKASAHHFDRVVIIVLENGDYEAAVKDKNLAGLAAR